MTSFSQQVSHQLTSAKNKDGEHHRDDRPNVNIRKCPYNVHPLEPHFYVAKLGFTGVYLFFLCLLQYIDCGYSLERPWQVAIYLNIAWASFHIEINHSKTALECNDHDPCHEKTRFLLIRKTKTQISTYVFATRMVQFLFLNLKFQVSSHLWLQYQTWSETSGPVFSYRSSNDWRA